MEISNNLLTSLSEHVQAAPSTMLSLTWEARQQLMDTAPKIFAQLRENVSSLTNPLDEIDVPVPVDTFSACLSNAEHKNEVQAVANSLVKALRHTDICASFRFVMANVPKQPASPEILLEFTKVLSGFVSSIDFNRNVAALVQLLPDNIADDFTVVQKYFADSLQQDKGLPANEQITDKELNSRGECTNKYLEAQAKYLKEIQGVVAQLLNYTS